VSFGYSRLDPPLIDRLSLELRPGSRIALVGGSGSGKSTVARLVAGLYEPWTGEILFDGRPRAEVSRAVLSQSLAVVDQDISMFEGSLRDNLTLWDPTVSEQRLTSAAKDACIHDDITARPGGYGAAWRRPAATSAVVSGSASRSPARWWSIPASSSSTRRRARSIRPPRSSSTTTCAGGAARASSSPTG
jgi:ABC-type protease/lipase transport system fused ATPase/permease subunit